MKKYLLLLLLFLPWVLHARTIRTIDTSQGLTSQFVMTLCQDSEGFVWAGTYSGLNIIAGSRCVPFGMGNAPFQTMGNTINRVRNSGRYIWVLSNLGLERFDPATGLMRRYLEFNGLCRLYTSAGGDVIIQTPKGFFYAYNQQTEGFEQVKGLTAQPSNTLNVMVSQRHDIIVAERDRQRVGQLAADDGGHVAFRLVRDHHRGPLMAYAYYDGKFVFMITDNGDLLVSSDFQEDPLLQGNVGDVIADRGGVSSVVRYHNQVVIGFLTSGAVELSFTGGGRCEAHDLPVRYGVFDMLVDRRQDVLWLATDGGGLLSFVNSPFNLGQVDLSQQPLNVTKPVRAIYRDMTGRLWIGTKGDGIISIDNYQPGIVPSGFQHLTTANSDLTDNAVYKFATSRHHVLWMATDGDGLNYYSYPAKTIRRLDVKGLSLRSVMDVLEVSPSELWVVRGDGHGLARITLDAHSDEPHVLAYKEYFNKAKHKEDQMFYRVVRQNDRYLWFCCRDKGLYRYDRKTGKWLLTYPDEADRQGAQRSQEDDPIDMCFTTDGRLFCVTSGGLFEVVPQKGVYQWRKVSLPALPPTSVFRNVTSMGNSVWACTPTAIVRYDLKTGASRIFRRSAGIGIQELNDDGAWADPATGYVYFGDIGKVITISQEGNPGVRHFHPDIRFIYATNGQETFGINRDESTNLTLSHDNNNFTIVYSVPDFVDGDDYQYDYRINGGQWVSLGNQTSLPFTHLSPGTYDLELRYHVGGFTSKAYKLVFRVRPPWYWSWWMEVIYALIVCAVLAFVIRHYWQRQRQRQRDMRLAIQRKHREDIYESKLQFFATITHELTTPITLVSGSVQRILSTGDMGKQVRNYAQIIAHNCQRLNDIIQRVMTFRRVESDHMRTNIVEMNISDRLSQAVENFKVMADNQNVSFEADIEKGVKWPTDDYAFSTIVFNLLSNAFQVGKEKVSLGMKTEGGKLVLSFENNGLTLMQDELSLLSDQYKTLETLETRSTAERESYLGLAISIGLVKLLKGSIRVTNSKDSTTVIVELPQLPLSDTTDALQVSFPGMNVLPVADGDYHVKARPIDRKKATVVIVDDNEEMLWLLDNLLSADYNTRQFSDLKTAESELLDYNPDVIVANASMKSGDMLEACRQLKKGKITAHIPVIILSPDNSDEEATRVLQAGADMFIAFPCDMNYLLSAVEKSIRTNEAMKNYYESPLSGMVRMNNKFVNKEDQKFYNQMLDIIDQYIADPALSTKFIAEKMAMTVRTLYRRLSSFTEEKPVNIIKEKRLEKARMLLMKTNLTVEEICFKSGFTNRGTFYRLFTERYQCSPKQYHDRMNKQADDLEK